MAAIRTRFSMEFSPSLNVAAVWIGRRLTFVTFIDGKPRWA